jgi:hypothetical protein
VIDPTGTERTFSPLLRCVEDLPLETLAPKGSVRNSITLLRGAQGALFPLPGVHRIIVEAHWETGSVEAVVAGETEVMVASAVDEPHARAALKVLSTPDALLTLVLGGDHLDEGIEAIQTALTNPILRPHYALIEAKRVGERFGKRKANLKAAAELIDDATVMSQAEVQKTAAIVKAEGADTAPGKRIAKALKGKVRGLQGGNDLKKLVDSL